MTTHDEARAYSGASSAAIAHHYDLSNEFYSLWLDDGLVYSGALWSSGDSLAQAQRRKLDWIIDAAAAAGCTRVLDVGCGWGALLERLRQRGVKRPVGLTLSEEQAAWIAATTDGTAEVLIENWADHRPPEGYDAIVSVGAFEHFADLGLSRAERVDAYREFFSRCRAWLPAGGRLALQTIARGNHRRTRSDLEFMRFIAREIFRETEPPSFSEILEACEWRFDVREVRVDGEHYARTLREWHARLERRRPQAVDLVGEREVCKFEHYLRGSADHFDRGHVTLLRLSLERI